MSFPNHVCCSVWLWILYIFMSSPETLSLSWIWPILAQSSPKKGYSLFKCSRRIIVKIHKKPAVLEPLKQFPLDLARSIDEFCSDDAQIMLIFFFFLNLSVPRSLIVLIKFVNKFSQQRDKCTTGIPDVH